MHTIPEMTRQVWNSIKNTDGLHPGLTFFRLAEVASGTGESKHKASLDRVTRKTVIPFATALASRLESQLAYLESQGTWKIRRFEGTIQKHSRMAVGMGIPNLSENGLCLDQTHGIPIIPGSALKGVAQDYALAEEGISDKSDLFVAIFGAQTPASGPIPLNFEARKGCVVFFDAVPVSNVNPFEVDIMNPHYGDYYNSKGSNPPADYLKPNPIFFLTIKMGTRFRFGLAAQKATFSTKEEKDNVKRRYCQADTVIEKATEMLQGALQNYGVGGKTRIGYGLFEIFEEV